jgi:pimeloyl-ACP methyl ester carboxylesterase
VALRLTKGAFRFFGSVTPSLASAWAEKLFRRPPRQPKTRAQRQILAQATRCQVTLNDTRVTAWRWDAAAPSRGRILLVHGWGGHGARLAAFVKPLLASGFSVVSFDAPAHGESEGAYASVPEFVDALLALEAAEGPFTGLVTHSVGGMAAALAFQRGLQAKAAVFLAPPASPDRYSRRFARFYGFPGDVHDSMKSRFESRYRMRWSDFRIAEVVGSVPTQLLVFHDRRDTCVPLGEARAIVGAWRGARLVETMGLGHHRILRDPDVVRQAVAFFAAVVLEAVSRPEDHDERIAS